MNNQDTAVRPEPLPMPSPASRHSVISLRDTQTPSEKDASRNPFASTDDGEAFNAKVNEALQHWRIPGLALAVIDRHTVTSHGYGVSRTGDGAPAVTPATLFDIASMSKSFTAASMALLVQNEDDAALKDVTWQTPVSTLDPELQFSTPHMTSEITVEDILSHRTGLPGHEESVRGVLHAEPDSLASVVANMRNLPFSKNALRTSYAYNNLLYTCAAHLVSRLSSLPFERFLRTHFWEPLGMPRTWLGPDNVPPAEAPHVAIGSIYSHGQGKVIPLPHTPEPEGLGAGSIQSCVEDIARWIHAHMYRALPLSAASHAALSTPRILQDPPTPGLRGMSPSFYCLGWETAYYHGHTVVRHDGAWAGFVSAMLYVPAAEWGLVLLTNSEDAYPALEELVFHLLDTLLGVPGEQRFAWREYYDAKTREWAHVKTAAELFPELEEHRGDEPREDSDLRSFAGRYANKGYHDIVVAFNEEKAQLEVDGAKRSYSFLWVVRERAYGYWYVCENVDPVSGETSTLSCKFEVEDGTGRAKRFGVDLYEETGDLIWFDRVEG